MSKPLPPGRRGRRPIGKIADVSVDKVLEIHADNVDDDARVEIATISEPEIEKLTHLTVSEANDTNDTPSPVLDERPDALHEHQEQESHVNDVPVDAASAADDVEELVVPESVSIIKEPVEEVQVVQEEPVSEEVVSPPVEETHEEQVLTPTEVPVAAPAEEPQPVEPAVPETTAISPPTIEESGSTVPEASFYGLELLLRPFTAVPELEPLESLECVYNDEAVELQKQVLRAVKHATRKDKLKLEEFKINSRLYGNGFMEPHEYVDSMAKELGPLAMLVIVQCMLRLQPDVHSKNTLYVALKSYRAKNLARLESLVA